MCRSPRAGLAFRLPRTTVGQILAIVSVTLGGSSALITLVLLCLPPPAALPPWPWPQAAMLSRIAQGLRHAEAAQQEDFVAQARRSGLAIALVDSVAPCHLSTPDARRMEQALRQLIDAETPEMALSACREGAVLDIRIPLGARMLAVRMPVPALAMSPAVTLPMLIAIFCLSISAMALAVWAVRRVVRPLERLAEGARQFGSALAMDPLPEQGPAEVRSAARAFNQMQQEILRLLQERSLALAAIGHDLRTPLTRMRLRLELEPPSEIKERMLRDLEAMQSMLGASFAYLKGEAQRVPHLPLDLAALTLSVCDDFREAGCAVAGPAVRSAVALGHAPSLTRAITNLLENACRHGTAVQVDVRSTPIRTVLEISDNGPGIPPERRQEVLKPFRQLEEGTTKGGQGGLGLSIVQSIVQAHRGELLLLEAPLGGLMVRILLPVPSAPGSQPDEACHQE